MGRVAVCFNGGRLIVISGGDCTSMGLFSQAFENRSFVSYGTPDVYDDFWYGLTGGVSGSGKMVNRQSAMRLAALAACVLLISADKASLPLKLLKERKSGGTDPAKDEDLYHLLHDQPNPEMTSFTWRETGQGQILLGGNQYSVIERSGKGVKAIWPVKPEKITVKRSKSMGGYDDNDFGGIDKIGGFGSLGKKRGPIVYQIQGEPEPRPARDVLHVPGFGFNGLVGESVIRNFARESIGIGLSQKEFESIFFKQGFNPGGFFTFPGALSEEAKPKFIKAVDKRFKGTSADGSRRPMVLEDDGKFVPFDVKMADAQFIDLLRMTKEDLCGVYRVPPAKIGIFTKGANYNNTEQQNKSYLDNCMMGWIVRDEQAMNSKLLAPEQRRAGFIIKYNFDALLRPDAKARSEIDQRYWQMGVPLNTMRNRDDLNPVDGGDVGMVPLNFVPVDEPRQPAPVPVQSNARSIEFRATALQSVRGRDRVAKRYYPLFRDAAQKIVNRESIAVKKEVDKQTKDRAKRNMETWLNDFYRDMPAYIQDTIGPTMRSFAESIQEAAAGEIGADIGLLAELETEIREYIDGFTAQYVVSSHGQLNSLELDELETRVDEWHEKRSEKVASRQTVSMGNMVAASVFFSGGFRSKWAIRGPETCPYCRSLEGKTVARGEGFVQAGTEIEVEGQDPMPIRGLTKYPALHQGCDCYITAG